MKTFQTIFHHYRQMRKTLELVRYSPSIWSTNRGNRIIQITTQKQLVRIAIKGIEGHLKSTSITTKGILWEFFSLRLIHKRYRYMNQTCQCETLPQQCWCARPLTSTLGHNQDKLQFQRAQLLQPSILLHLTCHRLSSLSSPPKPSLDAMIYQ